MQKRKLIAITLGVLITLGATIWGAAAYMVTVSLKPIDNDGRDIELSFDYIEHTYPEVGVWVDSLRLAAALRDTFITNHEGDRLHAIYIKAAHPTQNTAILVHGYTDSAVRMLMIGHIYSRHLGYNILLPDLFNSGLSDGDHYRMGWKDRYDLLNWMEVANELFGGNTQMVVHGISMGAATTIMAAGEPQQDYVKCFVEDCGYTDVWSEFAYRLKADYGLPKFPILYASSLWCKLKYGWSFSEASALAQIKKCKLPMYFIHSRHDTYVPTSMVYKLYEAKKEGDKELWIVKKGPHAMSYRDNREEYIERVRTFVNHYITP